MRKYYIFIGMLVAVSFGLVIAVILSTGSPAKQRALQLDQERLNDFSMISNEINNYYYTNEKLPESIDVVVKQIEYVAVDTKDPESGNAYGYKVLSDKTYELCTSFSLSSDDNPRPAKPEFSYPYMADLKHDKGYDCIEFSVPTNRDPYGKPAPIPEVNSEPDLDTNTQNIQKS